MKVPNEFRIKSGPFGSNESHGSNGAFLIPFETYKLLCIASDRLGWDHVSVSMRTKTPSWKQMNFIKTLFWDDSETVVQFHPKKSEYVNNHPHCLHLWKKQDGEYDLPPAIFVGVK